MHRPTPPYTVSPELLTRGEFRAACAARDFAALFRLMKKYDGASQDRIASSVAGLTQSRVSRVMRAEEGIASLDLIERIADGLHIPGAYFGLAPREWEDDAPASGHPPATGPKTGPETGPGTPPAAAADPAPAPHALPHTPPAPAPIRQNGAAPAGCLVVESDEATLRYDDGAYHPHQRRRILNTGTEPITRYLMRISVDSFPGDPERSARLYRSNPLRWDDLRLAAWCNGEPMRWEVKTDWDAMKEVWLLFENARGRFPLYPGDSACIEYTYHVTDDKWGPWFQRAVRVPTRALSVVLDFPADLDPVVWGMETSMTASAFPFRTAIQREDTGDRRLFSWSTENPPLHARYRLEWNFRARPAPAAGTVRPSEQMAAVGVVQDGAEILRQPAKPFDLPAEAEDARRVVAELSSAMERVAALHTFGKGMGIAAPQIGINRAAAIVRTPGGDTLTLLNPAVIEESPDTDEQYEGCLSFFDVRGLVPRPLTLAVAHTDIDGHRRITAFDRGLARLVAHEIDHLDGHLYTERMRPGVTPIPVEQYRGIGTPWTYTA